jgi:hypothetical protein
MPCNCNKGSICILKLSLIIYLPILYNLIVKIGIVWSRVIYLYIYMASFSPRTNSSICHKLGILMSWKYELISETFKLKNVFWFGILMRIVSVARKIKIGEWFQDRKCLFQIYYAKKVTSPKNCPWFECRWICCRYLGEEWWSKCRT